MKLLFTIIVSLCLTGTAYADLVFHWNGEIENSPNHIAGNSGGAGFEEKLCTKPNNYSTSDTEGIAKLPGNPGIAVLRIGERTNLCDIALMSPSRRDHNGVNDSDNITGLPTQNIWLEFYVYWPSDYGLPQGFGASPKYWNVLTEDANPFSMVQIKPLAEPGGTVGVWFRTDSRLPQGTFDTKKQYCRWNDS